MSKERPIIMSDWSVRAILDGRKTQTRRMVKRQPVQGERIVKYNGVWMYWLMKGSENDVLELSCPFGAPGDHLWTRETWGYRCSEWCSDSPDEETVTIVYRADGARERFTQPRGSFTGLPQQPPATAEETVEYSDAWEQRMEYLAKYWESWQSPIHMPRWASRITLELTDVRVERLQYISEEDALADGGWVYRECPIHKAPVASFGQRWNQINAKRSGCSWEENPWVWVLSFERVTPAAERGSEREAS